jgi:Ca-activated chloride channel family protein
LRVRQAFVALVFLAAAHTGPAQDLPTYSESAATEYVMLPVVVQDHKGRFVDGLEKKDFRVQVHETPVELDTFERDANAPVSFAFLVDVSGSMEIAGKLEKAKEAIRYIVGNKLPGDDFALLAFAEEEVRVIAESTPDPRVILSALTQLAPSGQTALFDAVAATPKLIKGRNAKRAIILFTDGVDNRSKLQSVEMAEILQQVSTPVYAIGMKNAIYDLLTEEQRRELMVDNLRMLAASSGGKMFLVGDEEDLRNIGGKIFAEVRQQYLLGFSPSGKGEIKYRVVIVSVAKPGRWTVRTRRGYRGTAPTSAGATLTMGKGGVS